MMHLNPHFQNYKSFQIDEQLSRNRDSNLTQNGNIFAICCRPEEDGDVICGRNGKTVKGYCAVNFDVASSRNVRDPSPNHFVTAEEAEAVTIKCETLT